MTNRNNINSRLTRVNKQLSNLTGNNNGLNFKNIKNNSSKVSVKSSKVFIVIGIILLVIVLGVAGYFLYNYFTNSKVFSKSKLLIPYIHDASIDKLFSNSSIPSSVSGNEYNINMWLYVNDYNYRRIYDKCILFKGSKTKISNSDKLNGIADSQGNIYNQNKYGNPSIWLNGGENTLTVLTGLDTLISKNNCDQESGSSCEDKTGNDYVDRCEVRNFPLQRWVNVNVSLRNNVLDIFMDGTLKKSCILKGSPTTNAGDLHVFKEGTDDQGPGFNGYISKLEYTNKALSTEEIMKRYSKGPTVKVNNGFSLSRLFN
jgi:hypothetical protein